MNLNDFDYAFPEDLIAQHPLDKRDDSRLMVIKRSDQSVAHQNFQQIVDFINPGDVVVVNDSQVFKARLIADTEDYGWVECFLLRPATENIWECLLKCSKKLKTGDQFKIGDELDVQVLDEGGYQRQVRLSSPSPLDEVIERLGHVPLPPYIKRPDDSASDGARYQTIYAASKGSAAAPTAGLHFTQTIFDTMKAKGVQVVSVTLHVGLGTFSPIRTEKIADHQMHSEFYDVPATTADTINHAKKQGGKIFAVGTTTTRTLESACNDKGEVLVGSGISDKFIYPPYTFKVIDHLITNFHQPKSSLLVMVSALAGVELIRQAYRQAIKERYRLFSYGDAMLIL